MVSSDNSQSKVDSNINPKIIEGMNFIDVGSYRNAIKSFETALSKLEGSNWETKSLRSRRAFILCSLGICYAKLGQHLTAEQYFSKAAESSESNNLWISPITLCFQMGRFQDAFNSLKRIYSERYHSSLSQILNFQ